MKNTVKISVVVLPLSFFIFACPGGGKGEIGVEKEAECNKKAIELARNTSSSESKEVQFKLSSDCEGARAYIVILDGSPTHNDTNFVQVPPQTDENYPFKLPPGSRLYFDCGKGDGKCYYTQMK